MRTDNVYTYLNTKISGNWIENATIVPKDGVSGEFIGNSVVIQESTALFGSFGVREDRGSAYTVYLYIP